MVKQHNITKAKNLENLIAIQQVMKINGWFKRPSKRYLENVYKYHNVMFWKRLIRDEWITSEEARI